MPMAGVGLGHQLLILALGGTSSKMKVGHHGANYPTRKTATGNVVITTQNCGFSVTAPEGVEEAFVGLNDGILEGFRHASKPLIGRQFEACPVFYAEFKALVK